MTEDELKAAHYDKMNSYFCTVYRFANQEARDSVYNAIHVFDKEYLEVTNKADYVAKGVDHEGFFFVILRDKVTKEHTVFSYAEDGGIIKRNDLDINIFKQAFNQQHH